MVRSTLLHHVVLLVAVLGPVCISQTAKPPAKQPRDERSEDGATKVIEAFFPLFSNHDVKGLLMLSGKVDRRCPQSERSMLNAHFLDCLADGLASVTSL
jgi:hypothetical protein